MKTSFAYGVVAMVTFTVDEMAVLMERSRDHYDGLCCSVGKIGGFLYGLSHAVLFVDGHHEHAHPLTWQQVDMLCKILEPTSIAPIDAKGYPLYLKMHDLLRGMNIEFRYITEMARQTRS